MILIVVPVLGRPHQIEPLLQSIAEATDVPYRVVFVCSPKDKEARRACLRSEADTIVTTWPAGPGDFAKKVNLAYRSSEEEWLFQAATDLRFHPHWASGALKMARRTGYLVVGTNDLGNQLVRRGDASTHTLFARSYIEEQGGTLDGTGEVFSERYSHNFVDTEFVQIAMMRSQFAPCRTSVVEHMHPHWKKGEMDATYELGLKDFKADSALYNARIRAARQQLLGSPNRVVRRARPRRRPRTA